MNDINTQPHINRKATELDFQIVKSSEKGRLDDIKELLAQGANPNAWIFFGLTAAMVCASSGYADCLLAMADRVDLTVLDDKGDNALHKAAAAGHSECVAILSRLPHSERLDASGRSPQGLLTSARLARASF
jgi:ankyrin repeat protein